MGDHTLYSHNPTNLFNYSNCSSCQLFRIPLNGTNSQINVTAYTVDPNSIGHIIWLELFHSWNDNHDCSPFHDDTSPFGHVALIFESNYQSQTAIIPSTSDLDCNCSTLDSGHYFFRARLPCEYERNNIETVMRVGFDFHVTTNSPKLSSKHTKGNCSRDDGGNYNCTRAHGSFLTALFAPDQDCTFLQVACVYKDTACLTGAISHTRTESPRIDTYGYISAVAVLAVLVAASAYCLPCMLAGKLYSLTRRVRPVVARGYRAIA